MASSAVLAACLLRRNPVHGFRLCFHNLAPSNRNGLQTIYQLQKRAAVSLPSNKKNKGGGNFGVKENENKSNDLEPSGSEGSDAKIGNFNERVKSILPESFSLWQSTAEAFDLNPAPTPLKRKAQLAKLQMSLSRFGKTNFKDKRKTGRTETLNSVNLSNYPLSYYPPELRYQDVEKYIEEENWKKRRAELEKIESEKIEEEKLKEKKSETAKRSNSWVKTLQFALEVQRREDTDHNKVLQQMTREAKEETELIKAMQKEWSAVPGINVDPLSYNHPFQIKWDFYCQAHNDWQKRLDQFYHQIMANSTLTNMVIVSSLYALAAYYCIAGIFTSVYFKYSMVIRYQLIFSAGILSYCAGTIWGRAMGDRFLSSRLRKSPALALVTMVGSSALALWSALFNYDVGYILMDSSCLLSIGILYWMRHRGLVQRWHIQWMVPLIGLCIFSMLVGQYKASRLKATAATFIEEADLEDYFSITSVVKVLAPKWITDILFSDATEIETEDEDDMNKTSG